MLHAVAWLNDSSSADFYLFKVEAVRIGDSPAAPLFTLIVGPSVETEAVAKSNKEFTEREFLRQQWWDQLVKQQDAKLHRGSKPSTHSYISVSSGVPGIGFNYVVTQENCGLEVYIDRGNDVENKSIFDQLYAKRLEIESAFGAPLDWQRLND